MAITLSGLISGVDWRSLVDQLIELERAPQTRLRNEQTALSRRSDAYNNLINELLTLQTKARALAQGGLFQQRLATAADSSVVTATAATATPTGPYSISISQLATAARQVGAANIGARLSDTSDVSAVVLADAPLATPITAGTFTVNGATITISTTDTLQQVFDKISDATGGAVTASYNPTTDRIELNSSAPIQLGSAADTSNFLRVTRLTQNGTGSVTSTLPLGVVNQSVALQNANFATAISDGGSGAGEFVINGVSISFNVATDTLADVLARINNSAAGVLAQYDPIQDRVVLTNKTTGNVAMHLADVTGNFLEATGLLASAGGSFVAGQDLVYTLNGSAPLTSRSNAITAESHGISGLTITALTTGTTTVTVTADPTPARAAIEEFVAQYNKVQSLIASATATASSATGTTTNGVLAGDRDVAALANELRRLVFGEVTGLSGSITRLDQLGYSTNGNDDTLSLRDAAQLTEQLASRLGDVAEFFGHASAGLAKQVDSFLERQAGDNGYLLSRQTTFTTQRNRLEEQIAAMERAVQANRERLIQSFIAMERAQAQIQRQLQFLQQRFGDNRV